jgi:hypothetical protein
VFRGTVPSLGSRGEQVKRHGKNQVHYQYKDFDEPRRAPAVGHRDAVMVAISIITTAPGQNCRLIGAGPMP